tara:strand:- start:49 stop:1515 length:1467 start_codon:yes stop_codon:yes gene_type:complete
MVKLIRLQGDSDSSETEIRNVFSDGIMIPPNSKLGLRSCRVNFLNVEDLEIYRLPTDTTITMSWFAGSRFTQTITIAGGDYASTNALLVELQKQTNSNWDPVDPNQRSIYLGFHGRWVVVGDRVHFQMYNLPTITAAFGINENQFRKIQDSASTGITRTNGGIKSLGTSTKIFHIAGTYNIPLINDTFRCNLKIPNTTGKLEIIARNQNVPDDDTYIPWGCEIEDYNGAQRYRAIINNVRYTAINVVPTANDEILIRKFGSKVRVSLLRLEGDPALPVVQFSVTSGITSDAGIEPAGLVPLLNDQSLTPQLVVWSVKASANTAFEIENAEYQAISNMGGQAGETISTTLNLPRSNPLGSFLGFTDAIYRETGQPSTFVSDQAPIGRTTYSGIMVGIAAPGLDLDSYAGRQDRQNQSLSFLDVVLPQSIDAISNLIYQPNEMALLELRNRNPIELRNITIQFSRDDTGQPLAFMGKPMVMLVVETADDK